MTSQRPICLVYLKYLCAISINFICFFTQATIETSDKTSLPRYHLLEIYESFEPIKNLILNQTYKEDETPLFTKPSPAEPGSLVSQSAALEVFIEEKKHEIWGFGGAITESCLLTMSSLPEETQKKFREYLFDKKKGANLSMLRLPIGSNDFSKGDYTLNDLPAGQTDLTLERMQYGSLNSAIDWIQDSQNQYGTKRVMITPWTPPAWMKDTQSLRGGQLKPSYFNVYAQYLLKAYKHLQSNGVQVEYLSALNEPLIEGAWDRWHYPQAYMSLPDQNIFFKEHLIPEILKLPFSGLTPPQVLLHDHNWDRAQESIAVLEPIIKDNPKAVAGLANHCYDGGLDSQKQFHSRWPGIPTFSSECTGNRFSDNDVFDFQWWLRNLTLDSVQVGSRGALAWNLCLNENGGPQNDGCENCRGLITVDQQQQRLHPNPEYYALSQISRYVEPGARVIAHTLHGKTPLKALTAENPDGTLIVVMRNPSSEKASIELEPRSLFPQEILQIPAHSAVTFQFRRSEAAH